MKSNSGDNNNLINFNNENEFNIYVCGPTVYDYSHIGNLRPVIMIDLVIRYLIFNNIKIKYIHNITDIDDKIIKKSIELKTSEKEISSKYRDQYIKDLMNLNIIFPNEMPAVVENIEIIKNDIKELILKGYAYVSNGNVYFNVAKTKQYGKLSNQNISKLIDSDDSKNKLNPKDFSLWKKTKIGITFDSEWGRGRPGWHSECYSFVKKYFNKTIDLHAGGSDLIFPHHENENIQWEANFNTPLSKKWLHVGQINFNTEKMSKSLGNVFYIKDFLKKYSSNHLRYLIYSTHYTKPIEINKKFLDYTDKEINKIKTVIFNILISKIKPSKIEALSKEMRDLIEGNLNTSFLLTKLNYYGKKILLNFDEKAVNIYVFLLKLMGFNFNYDVNIELIDDYLELKSKKNYKDSDLLRDKIFKNIME